jgi:hypothetical protein
MCGRYKWQSECAIPDCPNTSSPQIGVLETALLAALLALVAIATFTLWERLVP